MVKIALGYLVMQFVRPGFAPHPRTFARGPVRTAAPATGAPLLPGISEDVKLFATTFLAGFLFVSIVIG